MSERYQVEGYYRVNASGNLEGLENSERSDDWSKVEAIAHDMLSNGNHIRITDTITGKYKDLHPEEYFEPYNGGFYKGKFPLKPQDLDPPYSLSEGVNEGMYEMIRNLPAGESIQLGGKFDDFMDNVFMTITKDSEFKPEIGKDEWNLVQVEFHIDSNIGPNIASTYDIHVSELENVLNAIRNGETEYLVDEHTPLQQLAEDKCREIESSYETEYSLLDRLKGDCEYFIMGGCSEQRMWAKSVEEQLNTMQETYDKLPEGHEPKWLTQHDIERLAEKMLDMKYPDGDKPIFKQEVVVLSPEAVEDKSAGKVSREITLSRLGSETLYNRTGIQDRSGVSFAYAYNPLFKTVLNVYKNGTINISVQANVNGISEQEDVLLKPSEKALMEDLLMGSPLPKVKQANHENENDSR